MTREEYGTAYERGFERTVQFLISRGVRPESALETAQAAWAKGWEKLGQLRDSRLLMTWTNTIALNMYRTSLRHPPCGELLLEPLGRPTVNLAAIDVRGILKTCKENDRLILQRHYLEGYSVRDIANAHGWSETAVRIRLLRARRAAAKAHATSLTRRTFACSSINQAVDATWL